MTNFAKELQQILKKNNKSAYKFLMECGLVPVTVYQLIEKGNTPQHLTIQKICENVSPKERTKLLSAAALDRAERKEKIENGFPNSEPEKKFPNSAQFDLGDGENVDHYFTIQN